MSQSGIATDDLEELLLKVSENDAAAITTLNTMLEPFAASPLPASVGEVLVDNINLIIPDVNSVPNNAALAKLTMTMAAAGVDDMLLRDALATCARHEFSDYPDPAGLIRALGVLSKSTDIRLVRQRFEMFPLVKVDSHVWHDSFGIGKIEDVDAFSDLIYVRFQSQQRFDLLQTLGTLLLVKPDSLAARLLAMSNTGYRPESNAADFDAEVRDSLVPTPNEPTAVTAGLLMPRLMNKKAYDEWRRGNATETAQVDTPTERTWENARSLEELKNCLEKLSALKVNDEQALHLKRLIRFEANKPLSRFVFGTSLAALWTLCPGEEWLVNIVSELPEDTASLTDQETVNDIVRKMKAKEVSAWLNCMFLARGREWFIDLITELPLRHWPAAETVLRNDNKSVDDLVEVTLAKARRGNASADSVVWLWKDHREAGAPAFSNPTAVFRVLQRQTKGDFIKARKELFKLLMDDQDFQRAVMGDGGEQGISNLVKVAKHSPVLNKGEQQSLLVKIVRIYPEAQAIVEERKKVVARRPLPKQTSYRSVAAWREELLEIRNKKIPANSAQIKLARSYGDLRENAEFKAAKDEQRLLMARKAELEAGLNEIIPTDFSDVRVSDVVVPGSSITIEFESGKEETFHLLGLWDSVPERKILSYDTPLGKALINTRVGDSIETPQNEKATIKAIAGLSDELKEWVKLPADAVWEEEEDE